MKQIILFLIVVLFLSMPKLCSAQIMVFDQKLMESIISNHVVTISQLNSIENNLEEINENRKEIAEKIITIHFLKKKIVDALSEVNQLIINGQNLIQISSLIQDIAKLQTRLIDLAQKYPNLLLLAYQTESSMISRVTDLFSYISEVVLQGGEENLISSKHRMEVIRYVVKELRIIRGVLTGVVNKMKIAERTEFLESIHSIKINYPDQDESIINKLLEQL